MLTEDAEIKELLNAQPHLTLGLESLPLAQQELFFRTLKKYGLKRYKQQSSLLFEKHSEPLSSYEPLTSISRSGLELYEKSGEEYIRQGKVGCLLLAGGQATRLGCKGPKGMVSIGPLTGKTLFELLAQRVICAGKRAQRALQLAVMTSAFNHEETLCFFQRQALLHLHPSQLHFFSQGQLPLLDEKGNWLLEKEGLLAEGPDGNGHVLKSFYEQGLWQIWDRLGIEYVNVVFIDNPLADPFDSEFIGFTIQQGLDIGMKVIKRDSLDEKMGVVVQDKNRIKVIEYSEFASEQSAQYSYASPGQFCFSMRFIRHLYEDLHAELPLHLAQKKALIIPVGKSTPELSSILKCETFQFDLLAFTEQSKALLCPRWRTYAPVKNAKGKNSPEEVKKALLDFDKKIYTALSGVQAPDFPFELDPTFYYPTEALKKQMRGYHLTHGGYISAELLKD